MKRRTALSWRKKLAFVLVIPIGLLIGIEGAARLVTSWLGMTSDELDRALVLSDRSPHFAPYPHSVFRLRPGGHVNELGFGKAPRREPRARAALHRLVAALTGNQSPRDRNGERSTSDQPLPRRC